MRLNTPPSRLIKSIILWVCLLATACSTRLPLATPPIIAKNTPTSPGPTATPTVTPMPPTATPAPRTLVVCLGEEPRTLYPFSPASASTWNILEAIYDGPVDRREFKPQPVILQKIPSLADGDAAIQVVTMKGGDSVLDVDGQLVTLTKGIRVFPSGCNGLDCAVNYAGTGELKMDQLRVTFKLLPGLTWSDGAPLKASDSVYSYRLASDPATPVSKTALDRTASYQALDDLTIEWTGVPGNLDPRFESNLWMPLPEHAWSKLSASELLNSDTANQAPLGWGPYVITEWKKGDHITLQKNPNYFRAKEGLPHFDTLVFRFIGHDPKNSTNALLAGECDLLDRTTGLDQQLSTDLDLKQSGKLQLALGAGPEWEQLAFGIKPASYDDGYNAAKDRADIFGDQRTRQAFAYCLDRQTVEDQLFNGQFPLPESFSAWQNPLTSEDVSKYSFNVGEGSRLLDEVGWKDKDNDPSTPRVAQGIKGVPDGTPLVVNYWATQAPIREQASQILAGSLAKCGIQAKVKLYAPADLYAPGPEGPLFGRQFDLVQLNWESSLLPQCFLFMSGHIPTLANHWIGDNITGFSDPGFDAACSSALRALPGQPETGTVQAAAQKLFTQGLPALPLYWIPKVIAARPDLCSLNLDVSARSDFWDIETLDYGPGCQKTNQ